MSKLDVVRISGIVPGSSSKMYWGAPGSTTIPVVASESAAGLYEIKKKNSFGQYTIKPIGSAGPLSVDLQNNCFITTAKGASSSGETLWRFKSLPGGLGIESLTLCNGNRFINVQNGSLVLSPSASSVWTVSPVFDATKPPKPPSPTHAAKVPTPFTPGRACLTSLDPSVYEKYTNKGTPPFSPSLCQPYRIATSNGCFQVENGRWVRIDPKKTKSDRRKCFTATSLRNAALRMLETEFTLPPTTQPPLTTQPPTSPPLTTQPPTSPPLTTQPPTSAPFTTEPPTSPPLTTQPPTSAPFTTQPPTSPPMTTQPPTTPPLTTQPPYSTPPPTSDAPLYVRPVDDLPDQVAIESYKFPGYFLDVSTIILGEPKRNVRLAQGNNVSWFVKTFVSPGEPVYHAFRYKALNGFELGVGGVPACTEAVAIPPPRDNPTANPGAEALVYNVEGVANGVILRFKHPNCGITYLVAEESGQPAMTSAPPTRRLLDKYLWKLANNTPNIIITTMPPSTTTSPPITTDPKYIPPSRLVKFELTQFKNQLRASVIQSLYRDNPNVVYQEISDSESQCSADLLGKSTTYAQMILAAYHPERLVQVIRFTPGTAYMTAPPRKGSDSIVVYDNQGIVDQIVCGMPIPQSRSLSNLVRIYYDASTDKVISAWAYDYPENVQTQAPPTSAPSTPAPSNSDSWDSWRRGDRGNRPDVDIRFPYPVSPDLLIAGGSYVDPLTAGISFDQQVLAGIAGAQQDAAATATQAPSPPPTQAPAAVDNVVIPEEVVPKEPETFWNARTIALVVFGLAVIGGIGYWWWKKRQGGGNTNAGNGNANAGFDEFGGNFGGEGLDFGGDFENFGPPPSTGGRGASSAPTAEPF